MAPELCAETAYDNKVDVWSVGVITFVLFTGTPPFYDKSAHPNKAGIYRSIQKDLYDVGLLSEASDEAKEFIEAALIKDQSQRPTIE